MLQYEVLKHELNEKQAALDELKDALGLERLREEVEMLENKAAEPGFYDNMESAQKILQKILQRFWQDCCVKTEGRDVPEPCFPLRRYADAH